MTSYLPQMVNNHHQQPQSIQTLLHNQLSREEFLLYFGTLLLVITGVTGFLKALNDTVSNAPNAQASEFGRGTYGGKRQANS